MQKTSCFVVLITLTLAVAAPAPASAQKTTRVKAPPGSTTSITTTPKGEQIITVTVNKKPVPFAQAQRPIMADGRVMVPLRGVFERLGGTVDWNQAERSVSGSHAQSGTEFRIRVGSNDALINGETKPLDAPARIANGTTYVPLRFASEAMGAQVEWDEKSRTVYIRGRSKASASKGEPAAEEPPPAEAEE